jgi:hypothetical protein
MNLNDERTKADIENFNNALRNLKGPRYTVAPFPGKRGYTLMDAVPRYSLGEDVEGVGWMQWHKPRLLSPATGWYKLKRVALQRASELNAAPIRFAPY